MEAEGKLILDATCGGRTIWFDKQHPLACYMDIRQENKGIIENRPQFHVSPDLVADFRKIPFPDRTFKLVVFDPPHMIELRPNSWIAKKYGSLSRDTWQSDIRKGFMECYRVLQDHGILILKWSTSQDYRPNRDITTSELLKVLPIKPLFGHTTGTKSNTIWMCFMRIPGQEMQVDL